MGRHVLLKGKMRIIDRATNTEISIRDLALKMYKDGIPIVWCDIECVLMDEDGTAYILDECGSWAYIDTKAYDVLK